jgi:hypothetical protein
MGVNGREVRPINARLRNRKLDQLRGFLVRNWKFLVRRHHPRHSPSVENGWLFPLGARSPRASRFPVGTRPRMTGAFGRLKRPSRFSPTVRLSPLAPGDIQACSWRHPLRDNLKANCLAPKVRQSKPMQRLLCELDHAVLISCDHGSLPRNRFHRVTELIR